MRSPLNYGSDHPYEGYRQNANEGAIRSSMAPSLAHRIRFNEAERGCPLFHQAHVRARPAMHSSSARHAFRAAAPR